MPGPHQASSLIGQHLTEGAGCSSTVSGSSGIGVDEQYWFDEWRREALLYRGDQNDVLLAVSSNVEQLLGYTPTELIGRKVSDYFDIDHVQSKVLHDLAESLSMRADDPVRWSIARHKHGQLMYLAVRKRSLVDEHGEVIAKEYMACDSTQSVMAALSLRRNEQQYRRLVEGIQGDYLFYAHDSQGVVTYVSPSVSNVLGYSPEECVGKNWRLFIGELHQEREEVVALQSGGEVGKVSYHFRVEVDHADGSKRLLDIQEQQICDAKGACAAIEGIARDVTEITNVTNELRCLQGESEDRMKLRTADLLESNERLTNNEKQYRHFVEQQGEFLVHWTPDLVRTYVNSAYAKYLGKTVEELLGAPFMPVILAEDADNFYTAKAKLTAENQSVSYEHRVFRADGGIGWVKWTDTAYFQDGKPVEYLSVGQDITKLREAEDVIRQKELHLAHVSRLATMGELVAGIAHEVNQPLHAASAFAEAARRRLQSGTAEDLANAQGYMSEIAEAISRTTLTLRRMRDFTKRGQLQREQLSLNEVVVESVEVLAFLTRQSFVSPTLELADELPTVLGDRIQLQQVCVNLITNACEAMVDTPVAERKLAIRTFATERTTCVSFCDCGSSAEQEMAAKMFDAFYTTKPGGMGMGLSICQSIAEMHQAELSVNRNSPEKGLTMTLELPHGDQFCE